MNVRFRYLAAGGEEVEVPTRGDLVRAIVAGSIQGDALLYDAEGGGWAPARHHSIFLAHAPGPELQEGKGVEFSPAEGVRGASKNGSSIPDIPFTFAAPPPLDQSLAVARLQRERSEEPSLRIASPLAGLTGPDGALLPPGSEGAHPRDGWREGGDGAGVAGAESPLSRSGGGGSDEWSGRNAAETPGAPTRGDERPGLNARPGFAVPGRTMGILGAMTGVMAALALTLILVVLLGDARQRRGGGEGASQVAAAPREGQTGLVPVAARSDMSPVEAAALQDMVAEMQRIRVGAGVEQVPSVWLEGLYLANATRYPEVRGYWVAYRNYVSEMRAHEGELFRASLISRLRTGGLSESMVSIQVARALRTFGEDLARRDAVYHELIELAVASIDLHDFLVEHDREISYEPARSGVSRDPLTEAVPETQRAETGLNAALDRVLSALERAQGQEITSREDIPLVLQRGLGGIAQAPAGR